MGNIQGGTIKKRNLKNKKKIKKIGGVIEINTQEDLILITSGIKSSNSRFIKLIEIF